MTKNSVLIRQFYLLVSRFRVSEPGALDTGEMLVVCNNALLVRLRQEFVDGKEGRSISSVNGQELQTYQEAYEF